MAWDYNGSLCELLSGQRSGRARDEKDHAFNCTQTYEKRILIRRVTRDSVCIAGLLRKELDLGGSQDGGERDASA